MLNLVATQYSGSILGPIAKLLGFVIDAIYNLLDKIGIPNVAGAIILFTIVIRLLLLPLMIRQQRFTKVTAIMNPELQAIQKKYQNRKDQDSMMKMQEETKMVYEKYGVSPTGSCGVLLIQMPILFALYRVMYSIPGYIDKVYYMYKSVVKDAGLKKFSEIESFLKANKITYVKAKGGNNETWLIDAMSKFDSSVWEKFQKQFDVSDAAGTVIDKIIDTNSFLGLNLASTPSKVMGFAILIPILAMVFQWLSTRIITLSNDSAIADDNPMNSSMKMMNNIMPIFSGVLCFTLQIGVGIYWVMSSVMSIVSQFIINAYFKKIDVNDIIAKNIEKANKKREKMGLPPNKITDAANYNTRKMNSSEETSSKNDSMKKKNQNIKDIDSSKYYNNSEKNSGSIASKANMVKEFNERNKK